MAKPAIGLSTPTLLFAGGTHQLGFEITVDEELKVDYVEAKLIGRQGWEVGSGKSRVAQRATYPTLVSRFVGRTTLPRGATWFAMEAQLPRDLPPSHDIAPAWARLELHLRIAIPWWFDHKYRWTMPVHVPPPAVVQRTPIATRSTPVDSDKPRIEVSLPSTRLIGGEHLEGAVAVFHLDDKKPREVELQLVPHLVLLGRGVRERTGGAFGWTVTVPAGSAGEAVPFQITLPKTVPSFTSHSHHLRWMLTARSGSFFGPKVALAIPLEIVDPSAAVTTPRLAAAPRLADERVGAVFARFAGAHGWQGHRLGDEDPDDARLAIERATATSTLRLTYAYRDDGTFLVARISTPSLGLGLGVTPSSSLRHVFWKDIEVDISDWDRAHHVTARYPEQAIPVLRAIVPTLVKLPSLGTLVQWLDDAITFERAVPTVEVADLVASEAALLAIDAAITAARFQITPPPSLAVDLPGWQALARSLGDELGVGDLSIDGKLGHVPVTLALAFDRDEVDRPTGLLASAGDPEHASAAARAIQLVLSRPAADALASSQLSEAVVEQLTRWPTDVVDLRIEDGVATARLPIFLATSNPTASHERAKELLHGLVAVLAAIDPGAGPYR